MRLRITRRGFLATAAVSLLATGGYLHITQRRYGCLRVTHEGPDKTCGISFFDFDSGRLAQLETSFSVHDIVALSGGRYIGANKYGPHYAEFELDRDFKEVRLVKQYTTPAEISLMGHIAVSDDGRHVCATAVLRRERGYQNALLVLDPRTLEIRDQIFLRAANPAFHDCRFLPGSSVLATTAGRAVDYVDLLTKQITSQKALVLRETSALRHFGMSENGRLAIQANVMATSSSGDLVYEKGEFAIVDPGEKEPRLAEFSEIQKAEFDREVLDFAFSVDGDFFGAVVMGSSEVSFWDFANGGFRASVQVPGAVRIALTPDGKSFLILTRAQVYSVSARTLTFEALPVDFRGAFQKSYAKGTYFSHSRLA